MLGRPGLDYGTQEDSRHGSHHYHQIYMTIVLFSSLSTHTSLLTFSLLEMLTVVWR